MASSRSTRKATKGGADFTAKAKAIAASAGSAGSFAEFLVDKVPTDKGRYSFERHEALRAMVGEIDRAVHEHREAEFSVLKGAQIGVSTVGIGLGVYLALEAKADVGYFLPDQGFANMFGKTRFEKTIQASPFLAGKMTDSEKGIKSFGEHLIYMLGLFNVTGAISIPLDANLYDEVDLIPKENMEWSEDRLAASAFRLKVNFSVGMFPGEGIDAKYQDSDQRVWLVTCAGCRREQVLEDVWPDCFAAADPAQPALVCVACGRRLDVEAEGRWVAQRPSRSVEHIGYRIPQLIIPQVALAFTARRWREALKSKTKLAKFRCSTLAKPDAGDAQPITDAVLERCTGDYPLTLAPGTRPIGIGVDCGDYAHAAVGELLEDGRIRCLYFEVLDADELEERLAELMRLTNAAGLVIDARPLGPQARRLAYAHPGRVWLQTFRGGGLKEDEAEHEGKTFPTVTTDRDESLDETTEKFSLEPPGILLPRNDEPILDEVRRHLKNLKKEKTTDARGNTIHQYRKAIANHFGMAINSLRIALLLSSGLFQGPPAADVDLDEVLQRIAADPDHPEHAAVVAAMAEEGGGRRQGVLAGGGVRAPRLLGGRRVFGQDEQDGQD